MQVYRSGDTSTFLMPDNFTNINTREFSALFDKELANGAKIVVIDGSQMNFIDSMGIGTLVRSLKLLKSISGELIIKDLLEDPMDLFLSAGLNDLFTMQKGEDKKAPIEDLFFNDGVDLEVGLEYREIKNAGIITFSGMVSTSDTIKKIKEMALLAMAEKNKLLLDFDELTYLDSMGAGEIMMIYNLLKSSNGELRISNANTIISDLLETMGFDQIFAFYDSTEDAIKNW